MKPKSAKQTRLVNNIIVHVVLAILAAIWVFPVLWVVMTSFRAEKGSYVSTFFPKSYTLDNYIKLFNDTTLLNFPKMFMNTLIVAIFSCLLSTFLLLSVSYCPSRMRFKMRKPYMNMAMVLGLFAEDGARGGGKRPQGGAAVEFALKFNGVEILCVRHNHTIKKGARPDAFPDIAWRTAPL